MSDLQLAAFKSAVSRVTDWLGTRPVTLELGQELSGQFPSTGEVFREIAQLCRAGIQDRWLGTRGEEVLRWGRVIKPGAETAHYSVDVVLMTDIAGPRHAHPSGEIDMIIPLDDDARFDGHGSGWLTYPPGSAHSPTVAGGRAIILYLLPKGEIDFSVAS